jgi:mannose-6-phosphate isomerase-like protein (cupin superfamily)
MTLTNTTSHVSTDKAVLSYNGADAQAKQDVTMFYPTAETNFRITRAIAPQGSKFQTGAHWHEEYDEYMRIIKGRAKIRLGNTWKVYTPEDGEIKIARMVVHDICRADKDAKPGEEDEGDMIIEEWSDPCTSPQSYITP